MSLRWLESLLQDVRYGLRSLGRDRVATGAVVAMLTLGVGANVAIFTLLNAVWLRPLPYRDANRLVTLEDAFTRLNIRQATPTVPEFLDIRSWSRSFEQMAFLDFRDIQITGGQEPERVFGGRVTASFFQLLGVEAALGRAFRDNDNLPGNEQVVMLSNGLWQRAFASDPSVVGRTVMLDGRPHQVVGVLPAGFSFDYGGIGIREVPDIYVPFLMNDYYTLRSGSHTHLRRVLALGRLHAGVTIDQANAELGPLAQRLAVEHPDLYRTKPAGEEMGFTMQARSLHEAVSGANRGVLWLLFAAVGTVLLIACVNTAQFLLARSFRRRNEIAVRYALGATRGRLIRQFLVEAVVLAGAAAALGLWSGQLLVQGLIALNPTSSPLLSRAQIDTSVLAFTAVLAGLTALIFGLLPALSGTGSIGRRLAVRAGADRNRPRYLLVAAEVAMSVVLLACAAVLLRGLLQINNTPRGFSPDDVTVMQLRLVQPRPDMQANGGQQYEAYLARIRDVAGVDAAASMSGQAYSLTEASFVVDAHAGDADTLARRTGRLIVSPDYFRALRIPLVEGRPFTLGDTSGRPLVAIVNEEVARYLWPTESALGKQLRLPRPTTIVGVVGSTRMGGSALTMQPQIYVPSLQNWEPNSAILVRSVAGVALPLPAIKQAVWSVAPDQAVFRIRTMNEVLSGAVAEPRFRTWLLGGFAALALVLSAAGIYGLIAYLVSSRAREIAIRVAIGAQHRDVYWAVSGQTLLWTSIGLIGGLSAAAFASRLLGANLVGVSRLDVQTLGLVTALYAAIALAASYIPARRAFEVDAISALKAE
jgi:putative ABC transport system permease protein